MVEITAFHIYYVTHTGKRHSKTIEPSNPTNLHAIKYEIGEYLKKIKSKAEYYYVVMEIDRDGKPAYRTIIPKTLL